MSEEGDRVVQESGWGEEFCRQEETDHLFNLLPRESLVGCAGVLANDIMSFVEDCKITEKNRRDRKSVV